MKYKTKKQLKYIAQRALYSEYGFAPAQADIILLECDGDGTYILFEVHNHMYSFNSYIFSESSVWTGTGTITKQ